MEEEPYLLEVSRYIHLNPLRAKVVPDLAGLDRYPWTGHSALLGRVPRRFQAVAEVLGAFGQKAGALPEQGGVDDGPGGSFLRG